MVCLRLAELEQLLELAEVSRPALYCNVRVPRLLQEVRVTITQNVATTTNISYRSGKWSSMRMLPLLNGITAIKDPIGPEDNLKYDCKRVNVVIDKVGDQYYQDIDFRLTPQGNISWILRVAEEPTGIYTVHYESVIQYRATSAMHINRFAQVPDRSTGLVAQVKMPEQWMLQKEFLIIRRDKYGDEIKKTGIYGAVIDAQPFNPSPADTI